MDREDFLARMRDLGFVEDTDPTPRLTFLGGRESADGMRRQLGTLVERAAEAGVDESEAST